MIIRDVLFATDFSDASRLAGETVEASGSSTSRLRDSPRMSGGFRSH
jgi:hypothetical protein